MNKSTVYRFLTYLIAAVWMINGLFCKVLNFVPRHQEIVARILGEEYAEIFTILIGISEIAMAIWIITKFLPKLNAILQIVIVISMNVLEFILAPDLLLWGQFNILFALLFAGIVYYLQFILYKNVYNNVKKISFNNVNQHFVTANEIIDKSRRKEYPAKTLIEYFEFKKSLDLETADENLELRTEIVDALLPDFTNADIELIRLLFDEEIKCEFETQRHDNLYQLSFYLYNIGDLKDVYRIYTAKFDTKNMDVGASIDREMLYMNHKIDEVVDFVKNENSKNNSKILETLIDLKEYPDYESEEIYYTFINGYFYGHKTKLNQN